MTFWRLQCCHKNRLQDTKGIFRNNKSNDRQSNGHMKKRAKKKNNDLQNMYNTQKTRDRATQTSLKWCVN